MISKGFIKQQLLMNPSLDHHWYFMIDLSNKYSHIKQITLITDIIYDIALDLMNEKFSI